MRGNMQTMSAEQASTEQLAIPTKAWVVIFASSLFFFYEFIQMNMFNAVSPYLMAQFYLNAESIGIISSYYFIANVLFLFPAGWILDRVSTKKVILVSLMVCIIGTMLFSIATNEWELRVFRFFTGIGSAFCFLSNVRLASRWFPPRRLALIIGLIVTMAMIGGMIAQTPFTLLTNVLGWRYTIMLDGAFGLLVWLFILAVVKDYPQGFDIKKAYAHLNELGFWSTIARTIFRAQNWLCGIYTSLMNLPIMLLGGLWGIMYLHKVQGLSDRTASLVTSMLFFGTIVGSPLVGWLSDRYATRKAPIMVGAIFSLIIIFIIMGFSAIPFPLLLLLFFLLGFMTSTQIISYPTVAESNHRSLTATAVSIVSFSAISGIALFEPVFGWVMDTFWDGKVVNGVPVYSITDFQSAMWIFPIGMVVALLASLFIHETHAMRTGAK